MIHDLRKKLTVLFAAVTGTILTILAVAFLIMNINEINEKNLNEFQNHIVHISSRLQSDLFISTSWLAQMEGDNSLIISIEDNKTPLMFAGSWIPDTSRNILVERAKDIASREHIYTDIIPISSPIEMSSIFEVSGDYGDTYYGIVFLCRSKRGFLSMVLLSYKAPSGIYNQQQKILYGALYLVGLISISLASWHVVGRALRPVKENQKKQNEFIAAASHELRSPLAVIQTGVSTLSVFERDKKTLDVIKKECARMSRLMNDMLLLASSDAKTWSFQKESVDLDTLLLETYDAYLPIMKKESIIFKLEIPESLLPVIQGDKVRLKQVFSILLDNAVRYTPAGGKIILSGKLREQRLILSVEDQGCGIPDDKKMEVFERFYQIDQSRNEKKHFGLGLSIAKELVEMHNGKLTLTDSRMGGCCFEINLSL